MSHPLFEAFPSTSLSRIPSPFYNAHRSRENSLGFSTISDISDDFSKEFASIIEEIFSEKNSTPTRYLSPPKEAATDSIVQFSSGNTEASLKEPIINKSDLSLPKTTTTTVETVHVKTGEFKKSTLLQDRQTQDIFMKSTLEATPDQYLLPCNTKESTNTATKRMLKGDITGQPVVEMAGDNNIDEMMKAKKLFKRNAIRLWSKCLLMAEKYPIYSKEDFDRQKKALAAFRETESGQFIESGANIMKQCAYGITMGSYYLLKTTYKNFLRKMVKYSINHLEEFKDIDYQAILEYAKLATIELESSSKTSIHYKTWVRTGDCVAKTSVASYRSLDVNTGNLFPCSGNIHVREISPTVDSI